MKLVTLFLCLLLSGCSFARHQLTGGHATLTHSKTNTVFNVTPPDDGSTPTTQSYTRTVSSSNLVPAGVLTEKTTTTFNTNGTTNSVTRETSTPAPLALRTTIESVSAGASIAAPKLDTTKALTASYNAMKPLQYVGIALIVLGIIGGAVIAFVLKWPTLGLKLGGVCAAAGSVLLVFYKVLSAVSPTVLFLSCGIVVLGILALVLDHFHVFKSGQLAVHEAVVAPKP